MNRPDIAMMRERIGYFNSFLAGKRPEMPPTGDDVIPDYIEDVEALIAYVEELERGPAGMPEKMSPDEIPLFNSGESVVCDD